VSTLSQAKPVARLLWAVVVVLLVLISARPAAADTYVTITGSGSTWSQVAVDAWRVDVRRNGIVVNYNGNGSTAGRLDFIQGLSDFGVSEIPFQLHPEDGSLPEVSPRPFAYVPIVAGGTSFMYHLTVAGHRVTDLRLSGETVTKIFTGVITRWNDPQITRDYGRALPNEPITPVIRSDGSGTSAQFTLFMSKRYPTLWNAFCVRYAHGRPPCGLYSFYPGFPGSKAQSGSNGVADYVASSYAEGAITYVEYAYALNLGFPVAKVLNSANYYTQPTASNVAVALTKAGINADLTQNLDGVYANADPRTYPLSSYSYMIVPTDTHSPFNADKGKTLSTFINYFLCAGQQKAPALGYSPLPINLVQAGFAQVRRIPGNVGTPDGAQLANCHNPTFIGGKNVLLANAPYPPACDKLGAAPCGTTGTARGGGSGGGGTTGTGTGTTGTGAQGAPKPGQAIDPETGLPVSAAGQANGQDVLATSVGTASKRPDGYSVLATLTVAEILLALTIPAVLSAYLRRRREARP